MNDLAMCLKAVKISLARARIQHEVIVVDDGSSDGTPRSAISASKNWDSRGVLKLVKHRTTQGPAAARNSGAKIARGAIILFTDSDCLPSPQWVKELTDVLIKNPASDMAEGQTQAFPAPPYSINAHVVENRRGGRWLTCNLAVRRKAFIQAGGFDERYRHPVREDTDFAFAVLSLGGKPVFNPRAIVRHPIKQGKPGMVLGQAWQAKYDPLLFLKYPFLYLTRLKWIDGWFFPVYHLGFYAATGWLLVSAASPDQLSSNSLMVMGGIVLASLGATILARLRRRQFEPRLLPIVALESLLVPFARLWWTLYGFIWAGFSTLKGKPK